jgi:hypothetical protein
MIKCPSGFPVDVSLVRGIAESLPYRDRSSLRLIETAINASLRWHYPDSGSEGVISAWTYITGTPSFINCYPTISAARCLMSKAIDTEWVI